VDDEVSPLPKVATSQMLVKWAGASGDFNPLHYDDDFAASQGVDRRIIHGELKRAWLVQLMTDWIGLIRGGPEEAVLPIGCLNIEGYAPLAGIVSHQNRLFSGSGSS
jgi:acyl dehydratase